MPLTTVKLYETVIWLKKGTVTKKKQKKENSVLDVVIFLFNNKNKR